MEKLSRHTKILTIFLSMVYACSLTGMGSVLVSLCDGIESQFFFPCKGYGCRCDDVGKELPNCRCNHSLEELESSCCSDTGSPPSFHDTVSEDTCCSEDSSQNLLENVLNAVGCSGMEEDQAFSALKHSLIIEHPVKDRIDYLQYSFTSNKSEEYNHLVIQKLLKIPITLAII